MPVPRGPKRKKLCSGALNILLSIICSPCRHFSLKYDGSIYYYLQIGKREKGDYSLFSLQIAVLYVICNPMKPVKFTRHAKNRMRVHGISESEVLYAIEKPEFLEPSVGDRINAWIKAPDRFLRVTYRDEKDGICVITAVKKKTGWR